jgi:single-stranded-DNA-specific exonuclease
MNKSNLREFTSNMNSMLKKIAPIERTRIDFYDLDIKASEINPQLMKNLDMLEPFGMGNPKPIFKLNNVELVSFDIMKDLHVRWNLAQEKVKMKGISFNYIGKFKALHPQELFINKNLSVYFTLGLNRFNGNESIQLMVEKIEH